MRLVQRHLSFDPDVISHIRAIITTFLNGGVLGRISVCVFTSPNHYFSNTRLFRELYADIEFTINVFKKPVMSSCLNQCGASQDGLDLLELIVEELLRRAGLYALSISAGVECSLDDTSSAADM